MRTWITALIFAAASLGFASAPAIAEVGGANWPNNMFERPKAAPASSAARSKASRSAAAKTASSSDTASKRSAKPARAASTSVAETGGTVGVASYYWQPQRVASGGWFNPNAMTAAHKTLPFGTRVRVTHLGNGRSVDVTINDRGPYIAGQIIDLSKAAAGSIQMQGQGVAQVRMSVLGR